MTVTVDVAGHPVVVDDEDADLVRNHNLYLVPMRKRFGAGHYVLIRLGGKLQSLHRVIAGTPAGMVTDHIDGDTLNNVRSNLRVCTHSQNSMNRGPNGDNPIGLKGVTLGKNRGTEAPRWEARIGKGGKKYHLGSFPTPEEAHAAYCAAAQRIHGEFARTA